MASNILGSDPAQTSELLRDRKRHVAERGETPSAFGYVKGSPDVSADPKLGGVERYAGDIFQGNGVGGPFAVSLRENQDARQGTEEWMSQLMSGIYSPLDMGPPPGEMV